MSKSGLKLGILCDTGFLIRLNQPQDELHGNARAYPLASDSLPRRVRRIESGGVR